ncbi:MBL fold metallo-hydrolase [bacterium]|nr:MBL fold metallo-hydrolase [bacterium]
MEGAVFYQLFESQSSTYTYLIGDLQSRDALLIDPVLETIDRDLRLVEELDFNLKYAIDTHIHADHVTAAGEIRRRTLAKTAVSRSAKVDCADIALEEGQVLSMGGQRLRVLATPGHTDSCLSFVWGRRVFTGDALLIRGNGRTDFQQGSPQRLYESIHSRLYTLPDDTMVYPAHDYRGQTHSTIGMEKKFNLRIPQGRSREEFEELMRNLQLSLPAKIHEAVPANLGCGKPTRAVV